jgi:hypothetical protein
LIDDLERYNTFLTLRPDDLSYHHILVLDISGLKFEITVDVTETYPSTTVNSTRTYLICPFDGKIDLTIISAGPDRDFYATDDNIQKTFVKKLIF